MDKHDIFLLMLNTHSSQIPKEKSRKAVREDELEPERNWI